MGWMLLSLVIVAGLMFAAGYWMRLLLGRKSLASAEQKSQQLIQDAARQAESLTKQAQLEAKEQLQNLRQEFEEKTKERRNELSQLDRKSVV